MGWHFGHIDIPGSPMIGEMYMEIDVKERLHVEERVRQIMSSTHAKWVVVSKHGTPEHPTLQYRPMFSEPPEPGVTVVYR